jgi:hypothetical protein
VPAAGVLAPPNDVSQLDGEAAAHRTHPPHSARRTTP